MRWHGRRNADRAIEIALFPFRNPITEATGYFGRMAMHICTWSGIRYPRNFTGKHFWGRGYAVSTVGFELEQVRQYIREQEEADGTAGRF